MGKDNSKDNSKDIRRKQFATLISCLILLLGFYAVFGALYFAGIRVNVTSSLPNIFWIVREIDGNRVICSGDYVVVNPCELNSSDFSPTARQRYFDGRRLFIKQICGVPGDIVQETCDVVVISVDSEGNKLPEYKLPVYLKDNEYWITSNKVRGFDSRYFGPVKRSAMKAKAFPLFTKEENN